jgi:small subunit ribosomal protein S6
MLLDPDAEEQARTRPLAEAQAAIESHGELLRHDAWGNRQLSYAIERRAAADYHLLQFHASSPDLLQTLDRSLRLADEVLRFRIIKLRPGVPEPPDMRATAPAPRRGAADAPATPPAPDPGAPVAQAQGQDQAPPQPPAPDQAAPEAPPQGEGEAPASGEGEAQPQGESEATAGDEADR